MRTIHRYFRFSMLAAVFILGVHLSIAEKKNLPSDEAAETGSGIIFFSTSKLEEMKEFYVDEIGCRLWLDQESCAILKYGNLLVGFCEGKDPDTGGIITFFYEKKEDVDRMYEKFKNRAVAPPRENLKYRIYHFFIKDPEGRTLEFQVFMHPIDWRFQP